HELPRVNFREFVANEQRHILVVQNYTNYHRMIPGNPWQTPTHPQCLGDNILYGVMNKWLL
ncbi:MAG TPA: hypothetical protein VKA49_00515, partial [Flavitalea sp.]|nr:hypothetical protein [Flavitalea sp.]